MEDNVKNRFVTIKGHINGAPNESDFEIKDETICLKLGNDSKQVVVKNLYVSVDPYQLNLMKLVQTVKAFSAIIVPGHVIDTYGIGRVVVSERTELVKDDLVVGLLTWGEYTLADEGRLLNKLDPMGMPLTHHLGPLGLSGLTAYAGFFEICKPKKGEKVFVSAASGSVGNLVGQYAKLLGCHVVGCAGSQQKIGLLKEKLGFDDAFNYKDEPDLKSALKRYFPNGIDIYFDNVGGEMLEAAVANMNTFGRVAVCGVISEYTKNGHKVAPDMLTVVYNRIKIEGFLVADHLKSFGPFLKTTTEYLLTGAMHVVCDISHGVDSVPSSFVGLFRGDNVGKKIVQISDE